MPKELIVIINSHRKLGELLLPYTIERIAGQSFFQLQELITTENLKIQKFESNELISQVIRITSEYSDKSIHKVFSKKKNLKEFFDTLDDKLVTDQIRPYIEKRIDKCIELLSNSTIQVYKKEKNYQVIHDDELVTINSEFALPVFNFIKTEADFKYFLSIRQNQRDVKLFNQQYCILSQKPSIVLLCKQLYKVENIDSKKLLPFFTKDLITVPKAREREYMETFVKNTIMNFPVKAIGFEIIEPEMTGKAVLALDSNLKNETVFILKFAYGQALFEFNSSQKMAVFLEETNGVYQYSKIKRNVVWESQIAEKLNQLGLENTEHAMFQLQGLSPGLTEQNFIQINWLNSNSTVIQQLGFEIIKEKGLKDYYLESIHLDIKIDDTKDWFDVHASVKIGEFEFPFSRFRKHIIMGVREFTLPNNQVVILPSEWFSQYREMFVFGNEEGENIQLHKHHFQLLKEALSSETGAMLAKLSDKLDLSKADFFTEPNGLKADLREYQKKGIHWMFQLYRNNFGGCLADDMGLGKTLQTIALLLKVKQDSDNATVVPQSTKPTVQLSLFDIPAFTGGKILSTCLIVMPVSLIHNWENEIAKFAPTLKVYKFFGTQRTRNFSDLLNVDIVLTSYGVVRNDAESLCNLNFKYIILDESQAIKNPDSKIYKAVTQLQSEHKLVLTGTPIENSLTDLWAQLNFLNRDLLKSQHYFKEEFVVPIEKYNDVEKQRKLQIIINPFILRRRKEEVLKELPSLTEQVLFCEMTEEQQKVYESEKSSIRNMIFDSIETQGFGKSSILILKALNKLRLLANHPILTDPDFCGDSGKFEEIARSIENVIEEKHKVLIFSSYVKHLNLVAAHLNKNGWKYSMLTGASKNRQSIIEQFQKDDETRIFLISLKAGGTGLNLTAADYVFILDPWWNPASENQAISRAHRIGQNKKVFVYRFLTRNTIEEKIQQLQMRKSAMADLFINSNNPFRAIGKTEIEELFK